MTNRGICAVKNIEMIVDAMSSYAAIPIDMKQMNIKLSSCKLQIKTYKEWQAFRLL